MSKKTTVATNLLGRYARIRDDMRGADHLTGYRLEIVALREYDDGSGLVASVRVDGPSHAPRLGQVHDVGLNSLEVK